VVAGGAIDFEEVVSPEILDPAAYRGRAHSRRPSYCNVLEVWENIASSIAAAALASYKSCSPRFRTGTPPFLCMLYLKS
jgi:hypothetical protein